MRQEAVAPRVGRRALAVGAAALLSVSATTAVGDLAEAAGAVRPASPAFTVVDGRYRPVARFAVSYAGTGTWATTYHSTPPNPGGPPDTNDASDSSTQQWSIDYPVRLAVPVCGRRPGRRGLDPCSHLVAPILAHGPTAVAGVVDHTHVDGLFRFDDATDRCRLGETLPPPTPLSVPLRLRYDHRRQTISVAPSDPVSLALAVMAPACPTYVDGIDGLGGNYFTPGFSFSRAYGPDRWFTPAPVTIRLATLHRAARITVLLGPTAAGTPPAGCAVRAPAIEQCHTSGSWRGTLTLTAVR